MRGDRIFGLVMMIVALGYILSATTIRTSFMSDPVGPRIFPYLIGGVTMSIAPFAIPADLLTYELALLALSAVAFLILVARAREIGRLLGAFLVVSFIANTVLAFS